MGIYVEDAPDDAGSGLRKSFGEDTSKVAETEYLVEVFMRIIENPKVMSPNSPVGPVDNYNEFFGQLKSKLASIDFLQTIRDNTLILFEIKCCC